MNSTNVSTSLPTESLMSVGICCAPVRGQVWARPTSPSTRARARGLGWRRATRRKARTAVRFKRPTKALEDAVNGGRTVLVALDDITPLEGGLPIEVEGQIIGAIGVSGVMSTQDAVVAQAGLAAEALLGDYRGGPLRA